MSTIDEMLSATAEVAQPPLVRWVKDRLAEGDELRVDLHWAESEIGSSAIDLILRRFTDSVEQEPCQIEWDDEFNTILVRLGVRSVDQETEGERFSLGLRAALRNVERRYGDGYLNAVFLDLLDESDLGKTGPIAEVREHLHSNSLKKTRSYDDCRELIASEIGARAVELREQLKYDAEELRAIMSRAIARYLDERFSVSRRRAMGWL